MREGKGREGKGREGKGREGKGREGKGREGKGREGKDVHAANLANGTAQLFTSRSNAYNHHKQDQKPARPGMEAQAQYKLNSTKEQQQMPIKQVCRSIHCTSGAGHQSESTTEEQRHLEASLKSIAEEHSPTMKPRQKSQHLRAHNKACC